MSYIKNILLATSLLSSACFGMEQSEQQESSFLDLPTEVRHMVFSFLTPKELAAVSLTSRDLYADTKSDALWRNLCSREGYTDKPEDQTWKQNYIEKSQSVTISLSVAVSLVLDNIETIQVHFNNQDYSIPYRKIIRSEYGYGRAVIADNVVLKRSEFKEPLPYTYSLMTWLSAWQGVKDKLAARVSRGDVFGWKSARLESIELDLLTWGPDQAALKFNLV